MFLAVALLGQFFTGPAWEMKGKAPGVPVCLYQHKSTHARFAAGSQSAPLLRRGVIRSKLHDPIEKRSSNKHGPPRSVTYMLAYSFMYSPIGSLFAAAPGAALSTPVSEHVFIIIHSHEVLSTSDTH